MNRRRHRAHHPPGAESGGALAVEIVGGVELRASTNDGSSGNVAVEVAAMAQSYGHRPRRDPVHLRRKKRVLEGSKLGFGKKRLVFSLRGALF